MTTRRTQGQTIDCGRCLTLQIELFNHHGDEIEALRKANQSSADSPMLIIGELMALTAKLAGFANVGLFKRPDSKYWWLYLETMAARERTEILLGETVAQQKGRQAAREGRPISGGCSSSPSNCSSGCPTARR